MSFGVPELPAYRYANEVPLRDREDALPVNGDELTITKEPHRTFLYRNAFATKHLIDRTTVEVLVQAGRARWKIENEKTKGSPTALRCRDVVDLVLSYLEDTLDPGERQILEAHIADCPKCWRFLQSYRETVALGQQLREEALPPEVREHLQTFLRTSLPRPS
ncbi:MAG: zf-HC2 domain-containing protein [Nitrospinae bacterium]|nr:zf-HC2 domain-containing protein [Nitrospinota bacterium]